MTNAPAPGCADMQRWIDREKGSLIAHGDFNSLHGAYLDHARRWGSDPDPLVSTLMSHGLACAALYVSSRPRDEQVGWTLSFQKPALNIFLSADASTGSVTGRGFSVGLGI